ncbi:MAG: GEVED domain-containing protein, partial [Bacteroidota bacterium]|nr:GEVED domain-containing protein [Bacteroidota bacterium]
MKRFVRVIRLSLILLFTCVFFNESYTQCPYAIDQQQGVSNIGVYGTNQWQSFIAGGSQRMGSIDLYSNAAYAFNGNITLRLYSGTGTGGSQIYTNIYYFDTVPSGWIMLEIPWGSAPTLSSGSSYTLRVQTSNNLYLRASIGNTYSNGHYYSNVYGTYPGWDLMFRNTWGDKVSIVHNLLGDTEYCENGPYAAVWMDDTETGINYKLYRDGVFVQTSSGSGYSKNFSPQSTEGNYTVIAQNPFTTCTYDMQGDIDIVEILRPVVGAGADDTLCGYQYTLQGTLAENYSSINWTSTGSGTFDNSSSLTPTYTATDADLMDRWVELILTAQPNSPCLNAESDTMLLRVFERADAGINDTICKGTDFLLNGSFYGDVPLHDTMCIANCDMPQYCLSNSINAWYINIYSITVDDSMIVPSLWYPLGFLGLTDSVYTTIIRDSIFELKISTGNYYQFPENISAFFDWNRDGDFEDEDETVGYNSFNKQYNTFAADILVPPGAILGEINMRIIYTVDSVINPCGTYYIGQTVDVKINVMAKAPDYDIWFDWTGPNAFTSTQQRPILQDVSIYEAGNYHLEMTNQFGCVSTADIDLTILPKDTITPDTSICFGDTVLLTLTGPDAYMQTYSFEWSTGSTNDSIIVSPLVTTTYYVTVTGTTCTVVDEVVVTVHPLPVVDLGNDTSLCRWTLIEIDTNYVSYDWNNGMTDTYFFDLDTAGSYHVVVVDTNTCTNTSDTVNISVLETPASFTGLANNYLTNASPATLTGSPTGGTFSGSGISGNTFTPVNAGLGIHDITYTYVDATPCSNTETQNTQVYANDLSMISILSPETGYLTAAETVTVQIKNRGLNSVDNMIVSFQAAATGINISESVSQSIAPDDTLTYTFLQTVDMSTEEEYFCTASVTTPGDEIASNDSLNVSITNYVGSNCMNPFMYTFTSNNIPTINDSITAINWYKFTLDSAYINFSFAFTPNPAWANMDVDIWEDCSLNNEIIPDNSTILPASITLNFDTIWQGTYIVRVTGSGDYSLDVTGYNGIYGCTNPNSPSYNPAADFDDGSCQNISYDCGVNPLPPFNPIPAQISTDINWNTDSIIINCDVDILDGVTVTVAPGTVVLFNTSAKINVEGTFVAIGNMLDSIIFKADNQFMGCQFVFDNGPVPGAAGAMSNNDTSRFEYCIFTKNRVDDLLIRIDNFSRLVIRNNHFTENIVSTYTTGNHGLILCENSSQPIISTNLFNLNLLQCFPSDIGGIIVCENSDPLIAYNNLTFNSVHSNLAGVIVCLNSSDPEITRNHIIANLNAGDGAGAILCLTNSNPNVSQNLVMENLIGSDIVGGAIFCFDASGIFTENIVSHNLGQLGGGFCCVASEVEIDNNIIQFNIAAAINTTGGNGGGIGIYDGSHVIISNCLIHANKALLDNTSSQSSGMGGGIYINDSEIDMYNNVISFNDGIMGGGIAASDSARVNCTNNTICNNFSYGGGAMLCVEANTTFTNTIIYYNHSLLDGQIYILDTTINEINLVHCNIEGGQNGIVNPSGVFYANTYQNNIDIAPYFVDETAFNFELQFQSACINGGTLDTTGLGIPQNDIFGTPRILNDTIDIGAFEATRIGTCSNITENTVWNADTVCVACDIMVRDSATLTIDPGTVVEFLGSYKIDVQGRLLAVGTESDSILFTVADTTDFHDFGLKDGGWQGLQFDNGPLGAYGDMDDNDSSIISYCKINYAKKVNNYINGFSYLVDELLTYNTYGIDTFDMGFIWNLDTAFDKGGAIYVNNLSKLKISNSDISNNKAYMGGSVYCENNASPIITNTRICNNEAKTYGGGVFITGSSPKITNSIICNNSALEQTGGGISCYFSMPEFTNLTVSNNSGLYQAGVVFMGSAPIIKNSIFWGNSNIDSDFPVFQNDSIQTDTILIDSVLNISYSNIQGFSGGIENISSPPLFISPSSGTGSGYDALSANWSL